eukprot:4608837-Alexandrium_andersonii.AAC.1
MSASLVGSEMCIRDRDKPERMKHRMLRPSTRLQQKRLRPHRQSGRPVSYTHLTLPTICSV